MEKLIIDRELLNVAPNKAVFIAKEVKSFVQWLLENQKPIDFNVSCRVVK